MRQVAMTLLDTGYKAERRFYSCQYNVSNGYNPLKAMFVASTPNLMAYYAKECCETMWNCSDTPKTVEHFPFCWTRDVVGVLFYYTVEP